MSTFFFLLALFRWKITSLYLFIESSCTPWKKSFFFNKENLWVFFFYCYCIFPLLFGYVLIVETDFFHSWDWVFCLWLCFRDYILINNWSFSLYLDTVLKILLSAVCRISNLCYIIYFGFYLWWLWSYISFY